MRLKLKKLKIGMLSVHSSPIGSLGTNDTGGMSVCIREIARELGRRGHSVDIFTRLSGSGHKQIVRLYENVRLIHLRAGKEGYLPKLAAYPLIKDLFQELDRFRSREDIVYDFVHSHYWLSGMLGEYARKSWDIPHIVTFHTLGAVKNDIKGVEQEPGLRVKNEKQLAKTCHCIIASTEKEKEQLVRYYEASPDSIRVIPCGVDLALFRPLDKLTSRQQVDFHQNETLLLYVGRFVPSKGLDRLLEAMSHLRHYYPVRMMVVGGEDQQSSDAQTFNKLSQEFGVRDHVTFVGRIEQELLPTYYNAADILVVPSRYESFGLVALESLACGTPVLATRVGAMEMILREGNTGYLVDDGSPDALAQGIKTFIPISRTLSRDAIRGSVLEYGWENVTSALIKEYETILLKQGDAM